jgi:hypothetical protein
MELKDLKVSQLATACRVITGDPNGARTFSYKIKAIERVRALMTEYDLSMTEVLKAAGVIMIDGGNPEAPDQVKAQHRKRVTKQATLIDMLKRDEGATIAQITEAIGWQPHTIRGAISGALRKKLGLTVTSTRFETGERIYRV